ncbi:MAG: YaaC family protein [Cyanobacteriota bacterium]
MIRYFKDITAENPIKEVWKLLRFFRDVKFASDQHRRILNISEETYKQHKKYIEKQARQVGYCIRQAEEYFQASSQVGLATRPNLLYYGAVSLSQALILLRQNGEYSLDARRNNEKHNHHGLELKGLVKNFKGDDGTEAFFNSLQCNCFTKNGHGDKTPWGHFPLFYKSLLPGAIAIHKNIIDVGYQGRLQTFDILDCADKLSLDALVEKNLNSLEILKTLPDMYFLLLQLGIKPELCQGSAESNLIREYKTDAQGEKHLDKFIVEYNFILDGISPEQKAHFLKFYQENNPGINIIRDFGTNIFLSSKNEFILNNNLTPIHYEEYYPDSVDDINDRKFYIVKPETYIPELAAYLILLFCLGMLCRYYPDIWMKVIDENVQIAELTDSLLNIVYRKFPNLILDQMTETKHYVHS